MSDRFEDILRKQGVKLLPINVTEREREKIRKDPEFYLNFIEKLRNS
jgi:hypothetical protein